MVNHMQEIDTPIEEERQKKLGSVDRITGLFGRDAALAVVEQLINDGTRSGEGSYGLMLVDLNDFYRVNETWGTAFGDTVLSVCAQALSNANKHAGYPVCRYGSNTFLLVLKGDALEAEAVRLRAVIEQPVAIQDQTVHLSATCGMIILNAHNKNAEKLLRHTDTALHEAKSAKGGCRFVVYSSELMKETSRRMLLESELRQALHHNQLRLHYQPQYQTATGRLRGFEALLRWQHPELGSIPPGEFIPIAEETGLIIPIGEWVIREACRKYAEIDPISCSELIFSVNVSAVQLNNPCFEQALMQILGEMNHPPGRLELEITESTLIQNKEASITALNRLRSQGIRIALDDFGTGYSSLSYLIHLPIQCLKMDRSFVKNIDTEMTERRIVESIITLVHQLGIEIVAEGIETREQLALLKEWGCDFVQGYLLGQPQEGRFLPLVLNPADIGR
ncbi:putative bifunctional diguanylate cyclase/phosphodiesterase [Paenibacillus abyssi]|uniref:Diguanylate cyclase n=1 Tax=Paenibacillus abyssi TaxID=1340531 RepID=A0A917D1Q9_9BACL|nr:bifunctional diguanylate cyclase/phosphodiesterase [Paenibacillus abyssi]GGG06774.1 hypothetical protein GCM10010916_24630 [Paenibacillus abyssi]